MASKATNIEFLLSQVRNSVGNLAGGTVTVAAAGDATSTPITIWLDRNKATPAANPYTLDANGTAQLYADGLIKVVLKNAAGSTVYTRDNLNYVDYQTSGAYQAIDADYASLNAAIAAIGSTPTTLTINQANFPVTASVVVPSTLGLQIIYPGTLSVGSYTVTGLKEVNVKWFGAKGDGTTDDSAAFTKACASLATTVGGYPTSYLYLPAGIYKLTTGFTLPNRVGLKGDGVGNTLINIDGIATTDGITVGNGTTTEYDQEISDVWIYSTSPSTSRDLIVAKAAATLKMSRVRVQGAGRYNINALDTVGISGWHVVSTGAYSSGLNVNTQGASVNTTIAFHDSTFSDTTNGYGATVLSLSALFDHCTFEHNGVTDGTSGGLNIVSGIVTDIASHYENNAGHNIIAASTSDSTARNATNVTIINPTMVHNPAIGSGTQYGLYINGGTTSLVGGDYSPTARTIYINQANTPYVSIMGIYSYPGAITPSTGTLYDVNGPIFTIDTATGAQHFYGKVNGLPRPITISGTTLGIVANGASNYFDITNSGINKGDTGILGSDGTWAGAGGAFLNSCEAYTNTKMRCTVTNVSGGNLDFTNFSGTLTIIRY